MKLSDTAYFTARESTELEMAVVASSPAVAKVHRDFATRYRDQIDVIASAATKPDPSLISYGQKTIGTASLYKIDERPDNRGRPVYVIMQSGIDVTSRWTRADADDELKRLNALPHQTVLAAA